MIDHLIKCDKSKSNSFDFTILIPTWNNLEYLKNCIYSIQKNSKLSIQIIVIVNEGIDGTKEWLENQSNLDYIYTPFNIGICYGLNAARSLVKADYIIYVNDDMYLLPEWDVVVYEKIQTFNSKNFLISCTMIEPVETGNPCVVVKDYGRHAKDFMESKLLLEYASLRIPDWNGSTWPPVIVHKDLWDLVGGLSIEFSPGMYSDPDFSKKLFDAGVRIYIGLGNSLVYHFGSKSTKRVKTNPGRKLFILKWGISSRIFMNQYLKIGQPFYGKLSSPKMDHVAAFWNKLKRMWTSW